MPEIIFPSKWLRANQNVKAGDVISFLDNGKFDSNFGQWVFSVKIERTNEEKLFGLNKRNFDATKKLYGSNSDQWIGKKMSINIVNIENPKTGDIVPAIRLIDPNETVELEEETSEIPF